MVRGVRLSEDARERAVELVAAGSSLSGAARSVGVAVSSLRPWVVSAFGESMARGTRGGLRLPRPPAREPSGRFLSG